MTVHDREMTEPPRILCPVDPFHRRSKPSGLDHQLIGIGKRLHDEAGGELYVMQLDCGQGLYRDKQVNGLPRFRAQWQPSGDDGLITSVIEAVCTEPLSS